MRSLALLLAVGLLQACGSDAPSSAKAEQASANQAARDSAQRSRIDNPEALACLRANMTDEEWAVLGREDEPAERLLAEVMTRPGTVTCFDENRVVIYL